VAPVLLGSRLRALHTRGREAGPAGLAAALQAARCGLRVTLVDENAEAGGALLSEPHAVIDGEPAWGWLDAALGELRSLGVRVLTRTTAIGYYHQNMVGLCQRLTDHLASPHPKMPRERLWRVRAAHVVLAQGALEKPLVFDGNDRPGVMLAGAAQTYLHRYGVRVGNRVVVMSSHDSAWYTAFDLADAGSLVEAIVDARAEPPAALLEAAEGRGISVLAGHTVTSTRGRQRIAAVRVNPILGRKVGPARFLPCDCLLMSGGWTPTLHLFSHTKGTLVWDEAKQTFLPGRPTEACHIAGAARGLWGLEAALNDGARIGAKVAGEFGRKTEPVLRRVAGDRPGDGVSHAELPTDRNPARTRAFVDFQNDVTAKDLRLAVREGMLSIEHVKRYTTNGMATDQGKTSNINALSIAAESMGKSPPEVGITTFRPPYTPTTFGVLAGYRRGAGFEPTRKTPIDSWAQEHGAVFEPVALWRRARYFPRTGEDMDAAVARECRATRAGVGIFDASTLGKIEVVGPDAAEFMNRMYTSNWSKLAPGRSRYGVLLGDDGYIRDDGVIARFAPDRFHVTTTTGGAAKVLSMMEDYLQTEWPGLDVWLTSTTEHWATIALNGPNARQLLMPFVEGLDISAEAFPHMSVAQCSVAGIPARLFRVSFTGELGFEVNVPARYGRQLWEVLWAAGQEHGIVAYGTETMHVLRAEKGYIIVGQDTDGTVTPYDAGLGWTVDKSKPDFVGKRGLQRPDLVAENRRQLVGLLTEDGTTKLEEGAQVVLEPGAPGTMRPVGHVTSAYRSEAAGRPIALALVEGGRKRMGETVFVPIYDRVVRATVTGTVFYDPQGERLKL
jgi:sarcosine oxidase subunit alpha